MGSNKSTLDYYDYETGKYTHNIYAERNPGVVKELGDVGNDLQIYGNRLYAVINVSHLIEVMDVRTAKHIGKISNPQLPLHRLQGWLCLCQLLRRPRPDRPQCAPRLRRQGRYRYPQSRSGVPVGYQPDELVIQGDKLYVANSGGYRVPNYDKTISIIDLKTFTEEKKVDVAINLHRLELDNYGKIWVSSRGDYYKVPSKIFRLRPQDREGDQDPRCLLLQHDARR